MTAAHPFCTKPRNEKIFSGRFRWQDDARNRPISKWSPGNPGKRKLNDKEPTPAREIPSPPAHLTDWGKVAWGRLTVLLDGMGVLTVADTLALERLCDIYADILQLRDTIAVEGRTYTVQTEGGFLIKANPAVSMLADADRRF
ncbi:Phage terminase, small subunit [Raoultella planticola]|nr:Phage terminase, small subunit [Raoultella planticola]